MPSPYLVASLAKLRDEFNHLNPSRDKASDGWIGDAAHSASTSDHNPDAKGAVHAIDVDITGPWPAGVNMEVIVQFLVQRCRNGQEERLKYVIFNRRIWAKSSSWIRSDYLGKNPHDHHAHFSGVYAEAAERSVSSWHLEALVSEAQPTLSEIKSAVSAGVSSTVSALSSGTLSTGGGSRDGALTTLLARTDYLANKLPALLLAAIAAVDATVELDDSDLTELAKQVAESASTPLAEALLAALDKKLHPST